MWITIHTAGGGLEREATFDSILDLTNLIVCALHCGALHVTVTHALALLHTLSLQQSVSSLQAKGRCVNKFWNC